MITPRKEFMQAAINTALEAKARGDYALGAVVVRGNEIIASGGNMLKTTNDPSNHGEMVAMRNACEKLNAKYLEGCVLYTTHEPCPMCTSLAIWAKMDGIVYGASSKDMKEYSEAHEESNYSWRTIDLPPGKVIPFGNPKLDLVEEFMREECCELFHS